VPVSEDRQAEPVRRLLAGALGQEDERPMSLTMERAHAVLTFDDEARGRSLVHRGITGGAQEVGSLLGAWTRIRQRK